MLLSRRFVKEVLQNSEFSKRVLSVVVDEAHVVSHWGSAFRKKYGTLGKVRYFLPQGTPLVAVSATLPAHIRHDVLQKLEFSKDNYIDIDVGNDRPNVSLVVCAIQNSINSYTDLNFLIPPGTTDAAEIPKAFLYADNITTGTEIIDDLVECLHPSLQSSGLIRPYNAAHGKEYRKEVMTLFKLGVVQILVCTDAVGMVSSEVMCYEVYHLPCPKGCNIPDIDLVIQWKLPASLSTFVQRAGRAARALGRQGLAVLLVEQSAYEEDLAETSSKDADKMSGHKGNKPVKRKRTGKETRQQYARAHGSKRGSRGGLHDAIFVQEQPKLDPQADDEGLLVFIQTGTCHREVLVEVQA